MAKSDSGGEEESQDSENRKPSSVNKSRLRVELGEPAIRVIGRENNDGKIRKAILRFQILAPLLFALQQQENILFLRRAVPEARRFKLRRELGDRLLIVKLDGLIGC